MVIDPFLGIGPLRFGMDRAAVAAIMPEDLVQLTKRLLGPYPVIRFKSKSRGMFLNFDPEGRLEFVEMVPPCCPKWNGVSFLVDDLEHIVSVLKGHGHPIVYPIFPGDFRIPSLGVAGTIESEEPNRVESVAVHRKRYYEDAGL